MAEILFQLSIKDLLNSLRRYCCRKTMTGTRRFLLQSLPRAAAILEIIRQTHLWCHSMAEIHDRDVLSVRPLIKAQITFQGILQLK